MFYDLVIKLYIFLTDRSYNIGNIVLSLNHRTMKKYICTVCDYVYDPVQGDPDAGIEPGTAFEDLPDDWVCPLCGVGKDEFEPYEE